MKQLEPHPSGYGTIFERVFLEIFSQKISFKKKT